MPARRIFIGWDAEEMRAHLVAAGSLRAHSVDRHDVRRVSIDELIAAGLYTRKTARLPNGQLWDDVSQAPMSTGHAIARFFVPLIMGFDGWALFTDGDVLFRSNVEELFALADDRYAVMCVQHAPMIDTDVKKAGHIQMPYSRKNWSSVLLFNCGHEANRALTLDVLNAWPGRDLHAFKWLPDDLIGALPAGWNYLVGAQPRPDPVHLAHFTLGCPDVVTQYGRMDFEDEWWAAAKQAGLKVPA